MAILLIIDGMTDGGAFDASSLASLGEMEAKAARGTFDTVPPGCAPDTMTCVSALLNISPARPECARTWLEALGRGIALSDDDLALRCNICRIGEDGRLLSSSAADLTGGEAEAAAVRMGATPIGGYRSLLVLPHGAGYLDKIVTFAPHQNLGAPLEDILPSGAHLKDFVRQSLRMLSPYCLLPWAPSVKTALPALAVKTAVVTGTDVVKGMVSAAGGFVRTLSNATGDIDTDLEEKCRAALALEESFALTVIHVNGADEASHRRGPAEKRAFLRRVDAELLSPLLRHSRGPLLVTSDHATSPMTGAHLPEPQPFWLWGTRKTGWLGQLDAAEAVPLTQRQEEF